MVVASWPSKLIRMQDYLIVILWKESIAILDFLHGDDHQDKVGSETTAFDLV